MEYIDAPAPCAPSDACTGYRPIGDDSIVFRVNVPLSSEGVEVDVFANFAFARKGRVLVQTSFQTYFSWFQGAESLEPDVLLTRKIVDRIAPVAMTADG